MESKASALGALPKLKLWTPSHFKNNPHLNILQSTVKYIAEHSQF